MPDKVATIERLLNPGIIAIVRAKSATSLLDIAEALYAGGVRAIEATMTTPGALDSIRALPAEIHERMAVGVGTVYLPNVAEAAVEAGARFIVTPVLALDVVSICRARDIPVACGAYTPTEAWRAHNAGADFIKLFPAEKLGPEFVKSLLAPLPDLRIIPTGGVTPETAPTFMNAGCVALGVGGSLVSSEILDLGDWGALTKRARAFVESVRRL